MGTYDLNLKNLFDSDGREIIAYLFGENVARQESTDLLLGVPRFADAWYQLEDGSYLHLEFQSTNHPAMGWRMLNYRTAMAFAKGGWTKSFEIRQIVIYFGNDPLRMGRKLTRHGLSASYEAYDIRELPHPPFDIDRREFNVNLMTLLGETRASPPKWREMILSCCRLRDETMRLFRLLKLEALAGLRGTEFQNWVVKEIEQLALELNIAHTTLARGIYDAGRRQAWIDTLVEDHGDQIGNLGEHLEKLNFFQVKLVFDQVRKGRDLWDAYNDAERQNAPVSSKPKI
ncbi:MULTISPECIES: hypothetical protein [Rhizobium]|uniref:hypothetical protein n=1 Tax=Rhizobium TaxID=379 RepID=UPI001031E813|nr:MULTISPECIES: hypothetical protein [Rhizobium]TBD43401.1 hypothetical protein ELH19_14790 [Rhizobium ruizarguesonis]TBY57891.1 hypothetical protein E0H39_29155 [Rhizobium leguminosarum bv. viciae]